MQLLLFRHGIAESQGPDATDASRRLTYEGVEKTRRAARGLARFLEAPSVILTSPLTRALQTADIIAGELGANVQTWRLLAHHEPEAILREIAPRDEASIMLVGHEPTLSTIVALLCGADRDARIVPFKKAGCAQLELESGHPSPPRGRLIWLATPEILRLLGGAED